MTQNYLYKALRVIINTKIQFFHRKPGDWFWCDRIIMTSRNKKIHFIIIVTAKSYSGLPSLSHSRGWNTESMCKCTWTVYRSADATCTYNQMQVHMCLFVWEGKSMCKCIFKQSDASAHMCMFVQEGKSAVLLCAVVQLLLFTWKNIWVIHKRVEGINEIV